MWRPNIEILDIHKLLSYAVNKVISQDPLLFLTVPDLRLLVDSAFKQVSVLYIEDVELKFQICYEYESDDAITDKLCIELTKFSHINQYNGVAEEYDRYGVNIYTKMLYDDISTAHPYEEDLKTNKGLEILYKLKLIRLEK